MMKRTMKLMIMAVFAAALCMTACDSENGGENGGGSSNHEYPATANVIRNAVKDIDGNKYDAVQIGDQVWMAENLRTTRYADGTSIPLGETFSDETPYRYAPGEGQTNEANMVNVKSYGYLYNWPAAMHGASSSSANPSGVQGICPNGWHVPSYAEWTELKKYMKTQSIYMASGNIDHLAKALAATWGWRKSSKEDVPGNDPTTNNATGFSAVPSGLYRGHHYGLIDGHYDYLYDYFGEDVVFWSSTEYYSNAYGLGLSYNSAYAQEYTGGINDKDAGFSVRCVRNE